MENEQTNPATSHESSQTEPTMEAPKKSGGIGPVLGIIVIIILLALGGLYYFTKGIDNIPEYPAPENSAESEANELKEQGASTDLADIEADVEATDLSGLDEASADFDSELEAQ